MLSNTISAQLILVCWLAENTWSNVKQRRKVKLSLPAEREIKLRAYYKRIGLTC